MGMDTADYFDLTAYDAVWSLAHALQATKSAGDSIHNSTALLGHLRGVRFDGASGGRVKGRRAACQRGGGGGVQGADG